MIANFEKRIKEANEAEDNLGLLRTIYSDACSDFAYLSIDMVASLKNSRKKKEEIKRQQLKTMAEFYREYELSDEYIIIKGTKYLLEGYKVFLSGLKVRIDGLVAESKGGV